MIATRTRDLSASAVVQLWVITKLAIAIVCAIVVQTTGRSWSSALSGWDVQHYMAIAANGYANPSDVAFFPGLPALLRALTAFTVPMEIGGVTIGLVGSALATWALYRMWGGTVAALWMILPTAVFTTVGYTESPFCAAAFWAWERARAGRWGQAAALAALACTFRVSGLFLIGALAVMAMTSCLGPRRERLALVLGRWVWLGVPAAVLVAYVVYLHSLTGSWTAWFQAQEANWSRGFTSPIDSLTHTLDAANPLAWPDRPLVATVFRFEIVSMGLGVATTVVMAVRRRWAEASWVGIQVIAFGITYWFMSVNRAVLLWFPLVTIAASVVRWHPPAASRGGAGWLLWRGLVVVAITATSGLMLWWSWLYFTGQWSS